MDILNRAYLQLHGLYRSMTPGQRLTAALSTVVVLMGMGYILNHRSAEAEVDLIHGVSVSATQLVTMQAALAKANLNDHEIRGASIYVSRSQAAAYMTAL